MDKDDKIIIRTVLIFALILILIVVLFRLIKRDRIKHNCSRIYTVEYKNRLHADGADTLSDEGAFNFEKYKDSLCILVNKCIVFDETPPKASKGNIDFIFYDNEHNRVGKIYIWGGGRYGYFIDLGGVKCYSQEILPYFLFNTIRENQIN